MSWITYEEALSRMRRVLAPVEREEIVALERAAGRVCRKAITAPDNYPLFDNSAVDGYAVGRSEDARVGSMLAVEQRLAAGSAPCGPLRPGSAARVLTGSVVPENAYAVVMQEDVDVEGDAIRLRAEAQAGQHIRRTGDDFLAGAALLGAGAEIGAGSIGLLASQGLVRLDAYARPRVAVLTTGDELVPYGEDPPAGSLRDSNGPMLAALVQSTGAELGACDHVCDDRSFTRDALASLCDQNDVLLCAGGASVGDRDHIPSLIAELGEVLFHGVAIRPGKPVLMGRIGGCIVFGLPGNPASAFVTFELFAREAIAVRGGKSASAPRWISAPFDGHAPSTNRDDFVRCRWIGPSDHPSVQPVGVQGSFGLRSLADAHCLARIRAGSRPDAHGTVPVLPLG